MLELRDVFKVLGGRPVLGGMSLRVERGQTLVIVGPSGVGKSVTLQHMVGLMRPDAGQVLVEGEDIQSTHGAGRERILNKFGMLFQSGALINWMTVFENVALPLYEKTPMGDAEIREAVNAKLALVGLEEHGHKYPAAISGGMKKRAGLARAIVRDPQIVLYDEPTSGLDPVLSRTIDRLILDLQKKLGVTSVVVTHDLSSAFMVGDMVAMLEAGRVVECLPPAEFVKSANPFVQEFIEAQFAGAGRLPAAKRG